MSFDPAAPGGGAAGLVSWSPTQGNLTSFTDISQYLRGGFVWAGDFTLCASTRRIYIGIDSQVPGFQDRVLVFDASTTPPSFVAEVGLFFPVPTSMHAFCNATSLVALAATTVQADSFVRETLLIGNVIAAGREGLFLPFAQGDLPTFQQRNEVPLFLNGMMSEFAGQVRQRALRRVRAPAAVAVAACHCAAALAAAAGGGSYLPAIGRASPRSTPHPALP